jgi:DNA modification methylase
VKHWNAYEEAIGQWYATHRHVQRMTLDACKLLVQAKEHFVASGRRPGEFEKTTAEQLKLTNPRTVRYYLQWGGIDPEAVETLNEVGTPVPAHDLNMIARAKTPARQRRAARIFVKLGRERLEGYILAGDKAPTRAPREGALSSTLYIGDALDVLRTLADNSVDMIVTSPPYWQLRAFGSSLGLEATPKEYVEALVSYFRECYRVLKLAGTLWVNIGDTAASGNPGGGTKAERFTRSPVGAKHRNAPAGLKNKDLVGIPWMLAFALRDEVGFYLRDENVWFKTNPQPEPVRDRNVRAHEKVFLFSKSPSYNFTPIREPGVKHRSRNARNVWPIPIDRDRKYPHPARFPVALPTRCILMGSKPGDLVLDLFTGVGATQIAALELGRRSIGVDANEKYIRIAKRRIEAAGGVADVKKVEASSKVIPLRPLTKARDGRDTWGRLHGADRRQRPMRNE